MPSSEPRVSIIVLNWNSYPVTCDCLLSLRKLDYSNREVILVDNGSVDSSADKLAQDFPEVRLIKNVRNLGFAGGNNVGIRDALGRGTDYLLLLNNDTVVAGDFLGRLVHEGESDAQIGMLNPKIYFMEPSDRLWCAGGAYKPWWSFAKARGVHQRDTGQYDREEEVPFLTGCALLVKAAVARQIGLLDEIFFLGFEDADWCLRARQAGFKALYVPAARIWHKDSYDTRKNLGKPGKDYYSIRNSVLFARKHMPARFWPLFCLSLSRYLAYRTVGYVVRTEFERVKALYRGLWSGYSTVMPRANSADRQDAEDPVTARPRPDANR